jgi:[protein-PII] uridylyltransferase
MAPATQRQLVLATESLTGAALCRSLSDCTDAWLAELFHAAVAGSARSADGSTGFSLVAVGGYGRRELSPQSDIDVVLLTSGRSDPSAVAEALWYPVWDEGLKLGHAVRTVTEAVDLAGSDLDTATSMLAVRHIAGDRSLTDELADRSVAVWRKRSSKWLAQLSASVRRRHAGAGDAAFLLEPDVKDGRGGLRDVHAVHWAEAARSVMLDGDDVAFTDAYAVLLDARVELHRRTGRRGDILLLQEQDAVAEALGYSDADAFMRRFSEAARTIAWRSDEVWERVDASLSASVATSVATSVASSLTGRFRRERVVGPGVVLRQGQLVITDVMAGASADGGGDPAASSTAPHERRADPLLVLRLAVDAATEGVRIDRSSLQQLAEVAPPLPEPWPAEARDLFARLWLAGPAAIDVVESLDQVGLWRLVLPEWDSVRSKPQRNAYHTFTVDRHLCQTAVNAAALADQVDRPDLLVVGALLHDIGKGLPGDHTEVGMGVVAGMGERMGFDDADIAVLVDMVRHHLLLPDVATRRDLADDDTIIHVAGLVGSVSTLRLLAALTEADSAATGPAAWNDWKKGLVAKLVQRTSHVLAGGEMTDMADDTFPTAAQRRRMVPGAQVVEVADDTLTVIATDQPGLFGRVAGVLALAGMDVLAADVWSSDGMALEVFKVGPPADPERAWGAVRRDLEPALAGQFALTARLAARARAHPRPADRLPGVATPAVRVDNTMTRSATVIEVVADDAVGLLATIGQTLAELGLDIRSAKVQTLGPQVVDTFYVTDAAGAKVTDDAHLGEVHRALGHAIGL